MAYQDGKLGIVRRDYLKHLEADQQSRTQTLDVSPPLLLCQVSSIRPDLLTLTWLASVHDLDDIPQTSSVPPVY